MIEVGIAYREDAIPPQGYRHQTTCAAGQRCIEDTARRIWIKDEQQGKEVFCPLCAMIALREEPRPSNPVSDSTPPRP